MPTIKIINPQAIPEEQNETISVKIKDQIPVKVVDHSKQVFEFKLNMRRALNGDLMIFDHADIDIVVMAEKNKIIAFAKDVMSEVVYGAENRLFTHLRKRGIGAHDSIEGGNVYGSLEAVILESVDKSKVTSLEYALYEISRWIDTERPYFESVDAHDELMDDLLLDPDAEDSTELGEVPHEKEKGSIRQHQLFTPYLYGRYTY